MWGRFRFTIGGLMWAVGVAAVFAALTAWVMRSGPSSSPVASLLLHVGPMLTLLGFDAYFLSRRARAGRGAFPPDFDRRTFARDCWIILTCLYLPFFWLVTPSDWDARTTLWATMIPILPGFWALLPLNWILHQRSIVEFPLVILTATLVIAGLTRLAIRGRLGLACGLALLVAIPSSLLAQAVYRF